MVNINSSLHLMILITGFLGYKATSDVENVDDLSTMPPPVRNHCKLFLYF